MNAAPMRYPPAAPMTEPMVQSAAERSQRRGEEATIAMRRTSGGIGKTDDSTTAIRKRAASAWGLSAQRIVQS